MEIKLTKIIEARENVSGLNFRYYLTGVAHPYLVSFQQLVMPCASECETS